MGLVGAKARTKERSMKCYSRQFGEIEYADTHVFTFPEGIIGFEQLRKFLVIDDADEQPFRWLVSVEDSSLSFPLIPAAFIEADYGTDLPEGSTVFVVAMLAEPVEDSTVNLRAPILVDPSARLGRQVVLEGERYAIQHPLFVSPVPEAGR
jgi:flagellar assembly factor FliW